MLKKTSKVDIKLKDGTIIEKGTACTIDFGDGKRGDNYGSTGIQSTSYGVTRVTYTVPDGPDWQDAADRGKQRTILLRTSNLSKYFPGFTSVPSERELERWDSQGFCKTVTGKRTEPDGFGGDDSPSWLIVLGLI